MMMKWCLMSSGVSWHIRDKLWPMPKHGAIILYVHGNQKARWEGQLRTATSTFTQLLNYEAHTGVYVLFYTCARIDFVFDLRKSLRERFETCIYWLGSLIALEWPCAVKKTLLKGPERFLVQRNVENRPNYKSLVHNMTFKSNKMSLPWKSICLRRKSLK